MDQNELKKNFAALIAEYLEWITTSNKKLDDKKEGLKDPRAYKSPSLEGFAEWCEESSK